MDLTGFLVFFKISFETRDAHRCNVEAKRFKKSTFSNNVWAEGAWNRTMDQVSNPVDDSAFDMSGN